MNKFRELIPNSPTNSSYWQVSRSFTPNSGIHLSKSFSPSTPSRFSFSRTNRLSNLSNKSQFYKDKLNKLILQQKRIKDKKSLNEKKKLYAKELQQKYNVCFSPVEIHKFTEKQLEKRALEIYKVQRNNSAVSKIELCWKIYYIKKKINERNARMHMAAFKLQRAWKHCLNSIQEKKLVETRHQKATIIQKNIRGFLARKKYVPVLQRRKLENVLSELEHKKNKLLKKSVSKIADAWVCFRTRRKLKALINERFVEYRIEKTRLKEAKNVKRSGSSIKPQIRPNPKRLSIQQNNFTARRKNVTRKNTRNSVVHTPGLREHNDSYEEKSSDSSGVLTTSEPNSPFLQTPVITTKRHSGTSHTKPNLTSIEEESK